MKRTWRGPWGGGVAGCQPDPGRDPEVVFDRADGKYSLAEIREPGIDGFLVHATKGPHTHELVRADVQNASAAKTKA